MFNVLPTCDVREDTINYGKRDQLPKTVLGGERERKKTQRYCLAASILVAKYTFEVTELYLSFSSGFTIL